MFGGARVEMSDSRPGFRRRGTVAGLILTLVASLAVSLPAPAGAVELPGEQQVAPIPHSDLALAGRDVPTMPEGGRREASDWPAAAEAEVTVSGDAAGRAVAAQAEQVPVAVETDPRKAAGKSFRVRVADQDTARRAGVTGVVMAVSPPADAEGTAKVSLDYSSFRNAGGADFGSRLRLVGLPDCALSTPDKPECRQQTPLKSENNAAEHVVSAEVPLMRTGDPAMVLAAVAGPGGANGTFQASTLAPSGSWAVSGSAGGFSWNYPITVPPTATGQEGIAPKISLGYSSSSVDGRTAATNNQSSFIGQGWDYALGSIERTYRSCSEDTTLPDEQKTGDLCWAGHILTMRLGPTSVALVRDDASGTWRASNDSGARIELLTGADNGVVNGEHWRVTTTDGVQYYFGRNRPPGWASGKDETNSAWTVPVYGPHSTDPCYNSTFANAHCLQAWRWNLDYVEDPHRGATVYYYNSETNLYGANRGTTGVSYTRGGTLKRVDYGLRNDNNSVYGGTAPGQVTFDLAERCDPTVDPAVTCDPSQFTVANAKSWPDTPVDQQCKSGETCNNHAPTFWSTKRLKTITTWYQTGASPVKVDSYELAAHFPKSGDPELWLDSITRTGHKADGTSISLPPVTFTGQLLDNRVIGYNNHPAMAHWRLTNIATDTGGIISVTYNNSTDTVPACTATNVPTDLSTNDRLCYPVYWTPPFTSQPTLDYFHKYVTAKVEVADRNGISVPQVTGYKYLGTPAWHFDDNEVVKPEHRTYGQFRGFGQVEARTGNTGNNTGGVADQLTLTRSTYFRGMNGDTLPNNGTRSATVTNSLQESVADDNLYADTVYEAQTFNGDGGSQLTTTITDPVTVGTTAIRARTGLPALTANITATGKARTVTNVTGGGTRTATAIHRYDTVGRLVAKTETGDGVPDLCTTTAYADNTTSWIRDKASEVVTSSQTCPTDNSPQTGITADVRTYYDGQSTLGSITGPGDATRTETAVANDNGTLTFKTTGTVTYDAAGRVTSVKDALDRTSTTAYTPPLGGILSKAVVTNPKGQATTTEVEPARGQETATIDVAGRRIDVDRDAFGRITSVWLPGQPKGSPQASNTYEYIVRTDGPLAVVGRKLVDYGTGTNYVTTVNLFDGLGRPRQTQTDGERDGRVVNEVFLDSHGWTRISNNRYHTDGAPSTTLVSVADTAVDDRTVTTYDGSGRPVLSTAYNGATPTWSTRTVHGGDRVTTFPPQGAVTQSTLTDARGRTTELRQYTTAPVVEPNGNVTGGTYQATSYSYKPTGLRDKIRDHVGNEWTFGYDFLGRTTSQSDPDSGTWTATYDLAGQITSTTNARGKTLSYVYDVLGRKLAEHDGAAVTDPKLASWVWDLGQNGVGKLYTATRHTATGNYVTAVTNYDGQGNPTRLITQIPAAETGLAGNYTTRYGYSTTGLLDSHQPAAGGGLTNEAIGIKYNKFGRPVALFGDNAIVSASTYTPFGEASQYTLGPSNNTAQLTYSYDSQTRRLTGLNLSAQQANPQINHLQYTYDQAGNPTRVTETRGHTGPVRTQCYTYDPLRRLTEAWTATDNCAAAPSTTTIGGPVPYWTSWSFNTGGLRSQQTKHALSGATGGDTVTNYIYPASGAARPHSLSGATTTGPSGSTVSTYGYDESGNTTRRTLPTGEHTLNWDKNNRLDTVTSPAGTTKYLYDADGNQLIRRDPDKTTLYLPGQELTRDNTTGAVIGTRYYTHNGTTVAMRVAGTNPVYLASDPHGTNTVAVKSVGFAVSRRTFDPYGNQLDAVEGLPWPDRHGFLDKPVSEATGLTDIGARKYDAVTGRFISVDPVLDLENPQQWTGYAYANDNPITYADPSGLTAYMCPDGDCKGKGRGGMGDDGNGSQVSVSGVISTDYGDGWVLDQDIESGKTYLVGVETGWSAEEAEGKLYQLRENFYKTHGVAKEFSIEPTYEDILGAFNNACGDIDGFCSDKDDWRFRVDLGEVMLASGEVDFSSGGKGGRVGKAGSRGRSGLGGCKPNSFTGDTMVLMADGTAKRIDEIEVGDTITNSVPGRVETEQHDVLAVIVTDEDKEYVDLTVATHEGLRTIHSTAHHLFYSASTGQWVEAAELQAGDQLNTPGNGRAVVHQVRSYTAALRTYNLTISTIHTYYVIAGRTPVLVHNEWTPAAATDAQLGGPFNTTYYRMPPDRLGTVYWWSRDVAGHGESKWKIFTETRSGLAWYSDADINGTYIKDKHKGETGKFIPKKSLRPVNLKTGKFCR